MGETNNIDIVNLLIDKMKKEDLWFTQKTDPTWEEAKQYYKLDDYGDLTETSVNKIAKEIESYIGDGAVDIEDAIEIWLREAIMEYRVAYKDTLVTKFKNKPVVDGIEAYESSVQLAESKEIKTESKGAINPQTDLEKAFTTEVKYWLQGLVDESPNDEIGNRAAEIIADDNKVKEIVDELVNGSDDLWEEIHLKIEQLAGIDYRTRTEGKVINKNESYKRRLKEENDKSANLISDMITANGFDSESNAGKIVLRTSELFNALSSKGYDVNVSFDNGESTNAILLGQQGGQVVITINNTNQPLKAFTSGNFEVNDDNIKILDDIKSEISVL